MKKSNTIEAVETVVGIDVGDEWSQLCVLDAETGEKLEESRVRTRQGALEERFSCRPLRVAVEVGTHSPWISRLLERLGHEVIVANAYELRLIYENRSKDDRIDAEYLARLARLDPELLSPLVHRGEQGQADLAVIRARAALVESRTRLINCCRGTVKSFGGRLPSCDARTFAAKASEAMPEELVAALDPLIEHIAALTTQIRQMDRQIEAIAEQKYPETSLLTQIRGVGALTALTFVLTLEAPDRFEESRMVGAYLGLVPRRRDSGEAKRRGGITKEGDAYLRTLLVQAAHYILGPFGEECDLRRFGERLIERGGQGAKQKAAVAVARKLAVLMHRLWITSEDYEPHHHGGGEQLDNSEERAA